MRRLRTTSLSLLALVSLACHKPEQHDDEVCELDFEQIRAEIIAPNCTNEFCHDADSPAANLDFTRSAEGIAAQLVDVPSGVCADWTRVVAGDPERSILFAKLHDPPPCGERMPIDGELSKRDIACIEHWIEEVESTCETCGGDFCVDLSSDAEHCGSCGNACPAEVGCVAGECQCALGTELCADTCVDTNADPNNCGGCGAGCDLGQVCNAGSCVAGCDAGLQECAGSCVDTQTSDAHCGDCDNPCGAGLSCVAGECQCDMVTEVSFAAQVEPMLAANCSLAGCHAPPQTQLGLDLRTGKGYATLVGIASEQCDTVPRVEPGDPGNSYLLRKLRGVHLCGGFQMPLNTAPLAQDDIDLISAWICQGAQNN